MYAYSLFCAGVVIIFSILTTIVLRPYLPGNENDDYMKDRAAIGILIGHAHGIECPRNFTLHLLTNGSHLFQIQSRSDYNGYHSFESCEISKIVNYPWRKEVPTGATIINGSEAAVLREACNRVSYHVLSYSDHDTDSFEVELSLEETEAGVIR